MAETCLLAMRCPVYRRRESHSGFRTELENLAGDDKGKGASGGPARPKVPMRPSGADCLVVPMRRRNVRGGKGVGHSRRDRFGQLETGGTGRSRRKAAAFMGGTSRMSREAQVRICERLGVQFPGPTRRPHVSRFEQVETCGLSPRFHVSPFPTFPTFPTENRLSKCSGRPLGLCGRRLPELNLIPIQVIDPGKATVGFIHSFGVNLYSLLF